MTRLRAALLGYGEMGKNHARVLSALDGVDLIAIVDPSDVDARGTHVKIETSLDKVLSEKPDYCVVAVPTTEHAEIALRLADQGIHALIEKPITPDSASAHRVADAFEAAGLLGAVGHIERYNAALEQARIRLRAGELGEVYQIATRRQSPFPVRIADVGVIMDLASHDIDLTAWLGGGQYAWVSARTAHKSGRTHEDLVASIGMLSNGVLVSNLVNWLSPLKERTVSITGEKGTLVVNTLTADLTYFENRQARETWVGLANFRGVSQGDIHMPSFDKPEPLQREHAAFRDALLGRPATLVTMREAATTVAVAEAWVESAKTARSIALDGAAGVV